MDLARKIAHELTACDRREQRAAMRKGRYFNIHALPLELGAVDDVTASIDKGADPAVAFAEAFNPTRKNHGIARRVGLGLDVRRGEWVRA